MKRHQRIVAMVLVVCGVALAMLLSQPLPGRSVRPAALAQGNILPPQAEAPLPNLLEPIRDFRPDKQTFISVRDASNHCGSPVLPIRPENSSVLLKFKPCGLLGAAILEAKLHIPVGYLIAPMFVQVCQICPPWDCEAVTWIMRTETEEWCNPGLACAGICGEPWIDKSCLGSVWIPSPAEYYELDVKSLVEKWAKGDISSPEINILLEGLGDSQAICYIETPYLHVKFMPPAEPPVAQIGLAANPGRMQVCTGTTQLTVNLAGPYGCPITGSVQVTLETSLGSFDGSGDVTRRVVNTVNGVGKLTLHSGRVVGTAYITATVGQVAGYAQVEIAPGEPVNFRFDPIGPQGVGRPFPIRLCAVDCAGHEVPYDGSVMLTDTTQTISPTTVDLVKGCGSQAVTIATEKEDVIIRASDGRIQGTSSPFNVEFTQFLIEVSPWMPACFNTEIIVTAINSDGRRLDDMNGTANLAVSCGRIQPSTVNLNQGIAAARVRIEPDVVASELPCTIRASSRYNGHPIEGQKDFVLDFPRRFAWDPWPQVYTQTCPGGMTALVTTTVVYQDSCGHPRPGREVIFSANRGRFVMPTVTTDANGKAVNYLHIDCSGSLTETTITAEADGVSDHVLVFLQEHQTAWLPIILIRPSVCMNIIRDGGFELVSPNPYWREQTNHPGFPIIDCGSQECKFEHCSAYMGRWPDADQSICQSVSFPSNLVSVEISFYYKRIGTSSATLTVILTDRSGQLIWESANLPVDDCHLHSERLPQAFLSQIDAREGQVDICFKLKSSGNTPTPHVSIDNVELKACYWSVDITNQSP